MDRRVTPPKRVTTPTWGPPPPCKQALNQFESLFYRCTNQESVNKLCITDHDSLTRFLKTKTVVLFVLPIARQQQDCQQLLRLIKWKYSPHIWLVFDMMKLSHKENKYLILKKGSLERTLERYVASKKSNDKLPNNSRTVLFYKIHWRVEER